MRCQVAEIVAKYLRIGGQLGEAQIDDRSEDDEKVKAVPRIGEIVLEPIGTKLEAELADKEECEKQVDNIQEVCIPLWLVVHLKEKS